MSEINKPQRDAHKQYARAVDHLFYVHDGDTKQIFKDFLFEMLLCFTNACGEEGGGYSEETIKGSTICFRALNSFFDEIQPY